MKKYIYDGLFLEIGRDCNLQCKHCSNGESQNLVMSDQILDAVFDNIKDCKKVWLGSGESLLHIDLIENVVDRIIQSSWNIEIFGFTTNGILRSEKIIAILDRLCNSKKGVQTELRISRDPFHPSGIGEETMAFYKQLTSNPMIHLSYIGEERASGQLDAIYAVGRSKKLLEDDPSLYRNYTVMDFTGLNHQICVRGNRVYCQMMIAANGNVGLREQESFDTFDAIALGNILESSLADIIDNHNKNCCISCDELFDRIYPSKNWKTAYLKSRFDGALGVQMNDESVRLQQVLIMQIGLCMNNRALKMREEARKKFQNVTIKTIIKTIKIIDPSKAIISSALLKANGAFSDITEADVERYVDPELLSLYNSVQVNAEIPSSTKGAYESLLKMLIKLLQEEERGEEDYNVSPEFKTLQDLNSKCMFFEDRFISCSNYRNQQQLNQSSVIRCLKCGKVMINNGRPIHCMIEKNGTLIRCDYCGAAHDVLDKKKG